MRISDWSSDVCSSDLGGMTCDKPLTRKAPKNETQPAIQHVFNAGQESGLRVRRSRKRGSAMPAGTLYVGRGSIFGNPFIGETTAAVAAYRSCLTGYCHVSVGPDHPIPLLAFFPALEPPSS